MRIACFSSFGPGPRSAGLNLELLPLQRALTKNGHVLEIYADLGEHRYVQVRTSEETAAGVAPDFGSLKRLPAEINEAASLYIYNYVGRVIPPLFGLRDLRLGISANPAELGDFDAVIAYKPWYRTVVPTIRLSRNRRIPSILWIDDYDVNPRAPFLRNFSITCVNSRHLAIAFSQLSPLYFPHTIETRFVAKSRTATLKSSEEQNICVVLPGTGIQEEYALRLIRVLVSLKLSEVRLGVYVLNPPSILRHYFTRSRLCGEVHLLPFLSRKDVIALLDRSVVAIVIQPYNRYGFAKASGRLLECMARGVPVVVEDAGESSWIVNRWRAGLTFPHGDFDSMLSQVSNILNSPSLQLQLSHGGLQFFTAGRDWDSYAKRLVQAIREVNSSPSMRHPLINRSNLRFGSRSQGVNLPGDEH